MVESGINERSRSRYQYSDDLEAYINKQKVLNENQQQDDNNLEQISISFMYNLLICNSVCLLITFSILSIELVIFKLKSTTIQKNINMINVCNL